MKSKFVVFVALVALLALGTTAQAASFYVVDSTADTDLEVTLSIFTFPAGSLQFKTNTTDWAVASPSQVFDVESDGAQLLTFWKLGDDEGASLGFIDPIGSTGKFGAVTLQWSDTHITFETAARPDAVAPVPIAPSAILLGSGLAGMLLWNIRRRRES